jgi:hypothetical protein
MIVLLARQLVRKTRLLCPCVLCALLAAPVSGARADYTMGGTPGGAGKITIDPESGDRKVEVTPPPSAQNRQQTPVYVYPQAGRPGLYPSPPGHASPTAKPSPKPLPGRPPGGALPFAPFGP